MKYTVILVILCVWWNASGFATATTQQIGSEETTTETEALTPTTQERQNITEVERQLQNILRQDEKLERIKMKLLQQLDNFRDRYMESIAAMSATVESVPATTSTVAVGYSTTPTTMSTPIPTTTSTSTTSGSVVSVESSTSTMSASRKPKLIEVKEPYLEVDVRSPLVIILDKSRRSSTTERSALQRS